MIEFHRFLMALAVRPGSIWAMSGLGLGLGLGLGRLGLGLR